MKNIIWILALGSMVSAQTWYPVRVTPSKFVYVVLPVGTTYRLGSATKDTWQSSVTVSKETYLFTWEPDPRQDGSLDIDILETATPQTVVVLQKTNGSDLKTSLIIPKEK